MSKTKRAISLFLAIFAFLFFCCSGTIVQSARAIVGVDDALIAIIIAALTAIGITFVTTGAYDTLSEYVQSLLVEYAAENNISIERMFNGVQTGTDKNGKILVNNRFVLVIDTFAKWLKLKFNLANGTSITVRNQGLFLGLQQLYDQPLAAYYNPVGSWDMPTYYTWEDQDAVAAVYYRGENNYLGFCLVKDGPIDTMVYLHNRSSGQVIYSLRIVSQGDRLVNGYYIAREVLYAVTQDGFIVDTQENTSINGAALLHMPSNTSFQGYEYYAYMPTQADTINAMLFGTRITDQSGIVIDTDNLVLPSDNPDYNEGDGAIIDAGADWGVKYKDVVDQIEDENEYGDSGDATIFYEDEITVSEQVEDTPAQSISSEADEYQVIGLQDVFPFCIPFDIYSFFECLAADPVAPVVNWRFYVPGICDETITLDLSQFNTVAQIVRTMELLAFIVGLALVTREKFLRG